MNFCAENSKKENGSSSIGKKKTNTNFSAYLVDVETNKALGKILFNIEINIPANTRIVYFKDKSMKRDKKVVKSHSDVSVAKY